MSSRREYRVVEEKHGDDSLTFKIEYRNNPNSVWLHLNTRDTLDMAIDSIATTKKQEVISKKVVYAE